MNYRTKCRIRTILAIGMLVLVVLMLLLMPFMGTALAEGAVEVEADPLTWEYLATVGGCAVFTLLFVQMTKAMVDKLFYIPTTLYAYVIAVVTLLAATAFSGNLTLSSGLLTLFNGWMASATASKTHDVMSGN